jgi:glycosyltransferase involved in cell wall biosynthesis
VAQPEGQDGLRETRPKPSTILVSANSCWNIVNFRGGLIQSLRDRGFRIVVAAPEDDHASRLEELGVAFAPVPMNSAGTSVFADLAVLARYVKLFRKLRPFAYLGFTAKPNIYGSLAARTVGARVINNISGLGTVFIKEGPLTRVVSQLYRVSLRTSSTVFFQNRDDMDMFITRGLARREQARLLPGSGVDLQRFRARQVERVAGPFRFLLVGRLLWDKGVGEYVDAARLVRATWPDVRFQVMGALEANNRTAVPASLVERWRSEQVIEYLGESDDVRDAMAQADCIVLPSYREGLPRALLEGSAMAKPLIATDVPGCRDVVVEGETGYLCAVRSAQSLAAAMIRMLEMPAGDRRTMGERGRRKVEEEFCESRVVAEYLAALGT